jgi:hypothetical protein
MLVMSSLDLDVDEHPSLCYDGMKGFIMPPKRQFQAPLDVSARTGKPFNHGVSGYRYHKCKCEVCVNAQYAVHQKWIDDNKDRVNAYARKKHTRNYHELRAQAVHILGDACLQCKNDDYRVLQIDHINGGGREDRKRLRADGIFRSIIKNGHQDKYQLLCANCHAIKTFHS